MAKKKPLNILILLGNRRIFIRIVLDFDSVPIIGVDSTSVRLSELADQPRYSYRSDWEAKNAATRQDTVEQRTFARKNGLR